MLEYYSLQRKSLEEKIALVKEDYRYFYLLENPEEELRENAQESFARNYEKYLDLYIKGILSFTTMNNKTFLPEYDITKEELMEQLNVYKSNTLDFIKD